MAHPQTSPSGGQLSLFSLAALNDKAREVVAHPKNKHLISLLPGYNEPVLNVNLVRSQKKGIVATLGRDADIFVGYSVISTVQCSFEVNQESGVILLFDRSQRCSTQFFGPDAVPFEHERCRRVLVQKGLNTQFGMGGERRNHVQFRILWHQGGIETMEKINGSLGPGSRLAPTTENMPLDAPERLTRIHTPAMLKMRYVRIGRPLGAGSFGTVYKCLDVDSGKLMAVKLLSCPTGDTSTFYRMVKRELEVFASMHHEHIVEYIASQGWAESHSQVELFMRLKQGSLEKLTKSGKASPTAIAKNLFPQILSALDYLDFNGLIHRDIKPANILYVTKPDGGCVFQLADFGLANRVTDAITQNGTHAFKAPEMFPLGGQTSNMWSVRQTSKVDVWSFYVTIVWVLDIFSFRHRCYDNDHRNPDAMINFVELTLTSPGVTKIREMAQRDPSLRASAAQMLVKIFDGRGLTTPRNRVPPLVKTDFPTTIRQNSIEDVVMADVTSRKKPNVPEIKAPATPHQNGPRLLPKGAPTSSKVPDSEEMQRHSNDAEAAAAKNQEDKLKSKGGPFPKMLGPPPVPQPSSPQETKQARRNPKEESTKPDQKDTLRNSDEYDVRLVHNSQKAQAVLLRGPNGMHREGLNVKAPATHNRKDALNGKTEKFFWKTIRPSPSVPEFHSLFNKKPGVSMMIRKEQMGLRGNHLPPNDDCEEINPNDTSILIRGVRCTPIVPNLNLRGPFKHPDPQKTRIALAQAYARRAVAARNRKDDYLQIRGQMPFKSVHPSRSAPNLASVNNPRNAVPRPDALNDDREFARKDVQQQARHKFAGKDAYSPPADQQPDILNPQAMARRTAQRNGMVQGQENHVVARKETPRDERSHYPLKKTAAPLDPKSTNNNVMAQRDARRAAAEGCSKVPTQGHQDTPTNNRSFLRRGLA